MSRHAPIAVTGTGAATALGADVHATAQAIAAGRSAIEPPSGAFAARAVAAPPFLRAAVPAELESQVKFLNPSGAMAVTAAAEAVRTSGGVERLDPVAPGRRSLFLAQVSCAQWDCRELAPAVAAAGPEPDREHLNRMAMRRTRPLFLLEGLANNAFSFLATWFGAHGANTAIGGFDLAGVHAIARAVAALDAGATDLALVVGAAFTTELIVRREIQDLGLGVVPADGAGALVLERAPDAERRGAAARGWIASVHHRAPTDGAAPFDLSDALGDLSAAEAPVGVALGLVLCDTPFSVVRQGAGGRFGTVEVEPL